jgi:hypothetical protein
MKMFEEEKKTRKEKEERVEARPASVVAATIPNRQKNMYQGPLCR